MNWPVLIFFVVIILLIVLLAWVARPTRRTLHTPHEVLEALARQRHYARLPQILQALREEDVEYLRQFGEKELVDRVRAERTAIALRYLDYLQEEFQVLLEASRMLSSMAPELSAVRELDRFKQSLRFTLSCRYLRWRLRLGLQPWSVFGTVSDMAGDVTLQLEAATGRIGHRTMMGYDSPLLPGEGRSKPR